MEWKMIETKLYGLVEKVVTKVTMRQREEWVTAKELSERIPIFSQDFIKKHGECLPRERMEYYGDDGRVMESRWMYPVNALNVMVQRGVFRTADGTLRAIDAYKDIV